MTDKITSTTIRAAILKTFARPEWAVMFEVAPATGYSHSKQRYADAVMMSLWPSRGLDLHGVEIKVSRSDWKREAADPTKAERIAAYCDYWWVFVAPGVIHDLAEVPTPWGVREFDGKKLKTIREATRTEAQPIDRGFLASLLRRNDESGQRDISADVAKAVDEIRAGDERRIKSEIEMRTRRADEIIAQEKAFAEASGLNLSQLAYHSNIKEVAAMLKCLLESGVQGQYSSLNYLASNFRTTADKIDKALADYRAATSPADNATAAE